MLGLTRKTPSALILAIVAIAIGLTFLGTTYSAVKQADEEQITARSLHIREMQENLSNLHRDLQVAAMLLANAGGDTSSMPLNAYLTSRRNELDAIRWLGYLPSPQDRPQTLLGSAVTTGFDHRRDPGILAMLSRMPDAGLVAGIPATYKETASLALAVPIPLENSQHGAAMLALIDMNIVVRSAIHDVFDRDLHFQLLLGDQVLAQIPIFHQPHAEWHYYPVTMGTEQFNTAFEDLEWWQLLLNNTPYSLAVFCIIAGALAWWAYHLRRHAAVNEKAHRTGPSFRPNPDRAEIEDMPPTAGLDRIRVSQLWQIGEISASLAHDMGQPLNIIRLTAENALDALTNGRAAPEKLRRWLSTAIDQSRRAQGMLDSLTNAARRPTDAPVPISPPEIIQAALEQVQGRINDQGIQVQYTPSPAILVYGHRQRFEAVCVQLLINACEALATQAAHVPEGFVPTLTISCDAEAGQVVISISDNGPGFPPGVLAALERPYPDSQQNTKGIGVGLSIILGVVAEMRGSLTLHDALPGARIEIRLPPAAIPGSRRLLLVDDEAEATVAMADYLANRGWQVRVAAGGHEALRLYQQEPAHAVVTDLNMSAGDGWSLIAKLHETDPDLPIIAVTTGQGDDARRAVQAGAMLVLSKPASLDDLAEELEGAIASE